MNKKIKFEIVAVCLKKRAKPPGGNPLTVTGGSSDNHRNQDSNPGPSDREQAGNLNITGHNFDTGRELFY